MLSNNPYIPLLGHNALFAVYGTLAMLVMSSSGSKSGTNIEILSLLPFTSCPENPPSGSNESSNITFLRNYFLPNSLCVLSQSAKRGLDDGAADFNLRQEGRISVSHKQTQVTFPILAIDMQTKM